VLQVYALLRGDFTAAGVEEALETHQKNEDF